MPDTTTTPGPPPPSGGATLHLLSAVHQALDIPPPRHASDELPYLKLLDQRARLARASTNALCSGSVLDAAMKFLASSAVQGPGLLT